MEMNNESVNNNLATEGFTKLPNSVVEFMLLGELKLLEMKLLVLVIRLTSGCHREWTELIQADLIAADIAANRAKDVLASALSKGVLVRDGKSSRYKVGSRFLIHNERGQNRLDKLIHQQLSGSSQKRNIEVPEIGTNILLNEEDDSFQNSNNEVFPKQEHQAKDSNKDSLNNSDKENPIAIKKVDPATFMPHNAADVAARDAWQALEPKNPDSFGLYLHLAKLGMSADMFYRLTSEIRQDLTVENKGALFNSKAMEYCRRYLEERMDTNG